MSKFRLVCFIALVGLLLAACVPGPTPGAPATEAPAAETPAPQTTVEPVEEETDIPNAAFSARQVLAQQLGLTLEEVQIASVEQTEWPDSCLGVQVEGILCAQVVTPGYKVILEANGEQYEFHTDETGGDIRLAAAPEPEIGEAAILWRREGDFCETASVGSRGVAFGLCGGPLMSGRLVSQDRVDELAYFVQTYADFEANTPAGEITFTGQGSQEPAPAEQRMIAEWARLAYVEALGGRSGASYGLALAWHREGGIAGFCDDLEVYVTGAVYASSCRGGQAEALGRSRLNAGQLEQLFAWIDALKSFEIDQTDPATADAMTIRLVFSGTGSKEPTEAEKQAILDFAAQLYISAARSGSTPPAAASSAGLEAAQQALQDYFAALHEGRYDDAAGFYGGSYEVLTGYNPEVPAENHAALLEAACRINGFQCLEVRGIGKAEQGSGQEFRFSVEFSNPDGSLFVQGPCCGADETEMPPQSQFEYTVVKSGGKYQVQELPVYVP